MKVRLAGIEPYSVVDGPGFRMAIFFQGCPHNCDECHNPSTHDPAGGYETDTSIIVEQMAAHRKFLQGITFTGGDPALQPEAVKRIASAAHFIGMDVMLYTGYLYEELPADILEDIDYLVDGPYVKEQRDLSLLYRGSRNQRFINVDKSRLMGRVVLMEEERKDHGAKRVS